MDVESRLNELIERNKELEKELDLYRSGNQFKSEFAGDKLFKAFHQASYLMAISKSDSGKFVDANSKFLYDLGYSKDEIVGYTSDDLNIFADIGESNKYLKLISRLKKIKDYPVTLRKKTGETKQFLFSAETILVDDELHLLTVFDDSAGLKDRLIRDSLGSVLEEIFETVSSYFALFSVGEDKRFYFIDLNSKVEEVEFIKKVDVLGKCIDETSLAGRTKLIELLQYVRITENFHKLAASPLGDDSEGYYMGFLLTNGNIIITWEPGNQQKSREDLHKQGIIFRKFAEKLPEMIYEADLSGKLTFINSQVIDFFGFSKEDLSRGISLENLFPEGYREIIRNYNELTSPGQNWNREYVAQKKDGTLFASEIHSFTNFLEDKIIGYRGLIKDISRQKEYENQINTEKALLENLIESAPEAIAITDIKGKINTVNKEFSNVFGYSQEEAIGKLINELIVPDEFLEEADCLTERIASGFKEEIKTIRKDRIGKKIHVSLIASSITVNNEIVATVAIYRDITSETKNLLIQEILHNISTAALKQFELGQIYPIIINELGRIWDTNNLYLALYDKESDTLSVPFSSDDIIQKSDEKPILGTLTGWIMKNGKPVLLRSLDIENLVSSLEIKNYKNDYKIIMGVPLEVDGESIGIICMHDNIDANKYDNEDLTALDFIANQIAISLHLRIMFDDLIRERQKAEEAAQTKQLFMSTMSHEIRTPLNEVIGITNLLLQGNPSVDQIDFLKTLKFSGNHLLSLVNDVLDYNKIESGKIILEHTQFNLNDFLDEIMRSYSFRSKAKNLGFNINISKDIPTEVVGDPVRLNQVLSNLLSNALKFTSKGDIGISVKVNTTSKESPSIEFAVTDSGIGIPGEKHSYIFESFTQAADDTTRHFGGTGLGLAICKKLIEMQGGTIGVESEPGKGSTFYFSIPIIIPEKTTITVQEQVPEDFTGLEGKKILVAEDNKINFFVANKFLQGWGTIVTHAENGRIAIDLLEVDDFDLVLMDLHMPVMDGIEAIKIIRDSDNPRICRIPIVALTAAVMSESLDKIEELKINDYILKPFKPHDLFERIYKNVKR